MSGMNKFRKFKKPSLVVKRTQLSKKKANINNTQKLINEKLKYNNNALAKALSEQKMESQYLYTENLALRAQVQEHEVTSNSNKNVLKSVLQNSSDALKLLVKATTHITNNIVACQRVVGRTSSPSNSSRDSTANRNSQNSATLRRSAGKSPARGVVQPMVSGHTITKPVINLSRINMHRIRTPPNLSDVEEVLSPENSPRRSEARITTRRVNQPSSSSTSGRVVPQRIPSGRLSNDNNSNSPIVKSALRNSIRSPIVTLEDVSTLIRRSRNRIEMEIQEDENQSNEVNEIERQEPEVQVTEQRLSSPIYRFESKAKKSYSGKRKNIENQVLHQSSSTPPNTSSRIADDPLEGPSWKNTGYDNRPSPSVPFRKRDLAEELETLLQEESVGLHPDDSFTAILNAQSHREDNNDDDIEVNDENDENDENDIEVIQNGNSSSDDDEEVVEENNHVDHTDEEDDDDDDDDDNDDGNRRQNLTFFSQLSNVTNKRGSAIDEDDFTMVFNRKQTSPTQNNEVFDYSQYDLPVLENSLVKEEEVPPEPELTTNTRALTHNMSTLPVVTKDSLMTSVNYGNQVPTVMLPLNITKNFLAPDDDDDDDDDTEVLDTTRRKRKIVQIESSSDSEPSPIVKKTKSQKKHKKEEHKQDPRSASVVIEKLNKTFDKSLNNSTERSDSSECSNSSSSTAATSLRPRRAKAPANFKEPALRGKLRRE